MLSRCSWLSATSQAVFCRTPPAGVAAGQHASESIMKLNQVAQGQQFLKSCDIRANFFAAIRDPEAPTREVLVFRTHLTVEVVVARLAAYMHVKRVDLDGGDRMVHVRLPAGGTGRIHVQRTPSFTRIRFLEQ
ncbi:hypothetical protein [Ralstonia phage phiRSL1]|uniref:Uncharacterized protein n=1 Tax=Ralstonia phage phiRSL1 TaxID=1980924 RepID=B2ZXS8_9CAUD|nr:hypothetical protein RSL1_ORF039 [Ralstonia phage phiRSL1]BAG41484.1 hypothetical protein [Ralstonia phage phiRSL1]